MSKATTSCSTHPWCSSSDDLPSLCWAATSGDLANEVIDQLVDLSSIDYFVQGKFKTPFFLSTPRPQFRAAETLGLRELAPDDFDQVPWFLSVPKPTERNGFAQPPYPVCIFQHPNSTSRVIALGRREYLRGLRARGHRHRRSAERPDRALRHRSAVGPDLERRPEQHPAGRAARPAARWHRRSSRDDRPRRRLHRHGANSQDRLQRRRRDQPPAKRPSQATFPRCATSFAKPWSTSRS